VIFLILSLFIFLLIFLYPGIIFSRIFEQQIDSFHAHSNFVFKIYVLISFSIIYWVMSSLLLFSMEIVNYITSLSSLIIPIALYVVINLIKYRHFKNHKRNSKWMILPFSFVKKSPLKVRVVANTSFLYIQAFAVVLFVYTFAVSWILEDISPIFPAGFDRNNHYAIVIWVLTKKQLPRFYFGTPYNNYYPVGFHAMIALLIYLINMSRVFNFEPIFVEFFDIQKLSIISSLFVFILCFLIAFTSFAVFVVTQVFLDEISKEQIYCFSLLTYSMLIGYLGMIEPVHMLMALNLMGLFCVALKRTIESQYRYKLKEMIINAILCLLVLLTSFFTHVYAFIYYSLIIITTIVFKGFSIIKKKKRFTICDFIFCDAAILALPLLLTPVIAFFIYPHYVTGLIEEAKRIITSNKQYAVLARLFVAELPPEFTVKLWSLEYILTYIKFLIFDPPEFVLFYYFLLGLTLFISFLVSYRNSPLKGQISSSLWYFLFASVIYVLTPVIPKLGIAEVKSYYLIPIATSLGLVTCETWIISHKNKRSIKWRPRLKYYKVSLLIFIVLTASTAIYSPINRIYNKPGRPGRYASYIDLNSIKQILSWLNKNLEKNDVIVFPFPTRLPEMRILSAYLPNRFLFAGTTTDLPVCLKMIMLYTRWEAWRSGKRYNINTTLQEIADIISKYSIRVIIEIPPYKANLRAIQAVFPSATRIKINDYYSLVVIYY